MSTGVPHVTAWPGKQTRAGREGMWVYQVQRPGGWGRGWASGGRRRTQGQVALDLLVGHREDLALCLKEGQVFPASEGTEVDMALLRRDPSGWPVRWPVRKSRDGQGCCGLVLSTARGRSRGSADGLL